MTDAELDRLDRLAAEKVMGWTVDQVQDYGLSHLEDSWQPTRNIAQAWECLEKLRSKDGFVFDIHNIDDEWRCRVDIAFDVDCILTKAETAALAITLACLKSRGIEV